MLRAQLELFGPVASESGGAIPGLVTHKSALGNAKSPGIVPASSDKTAPQPDDDSNSDPDYIADVEDDDTEPVAGNN
jgi:hypothetical protein